MVALVLASPVQAVEPVPITGEDTVVWAVGDLCADASTADCDQVGRLIANDTETDAILGLGDMQYENGSLANYNTYYDPKMGRGPGLFGRTLPAPGNHEYNAAGATGYFDYFGTRAGDRNRGYYAVNLDGWNVIATNSNCGQVNGCGPTSRQGVFLNNALEQPGECEIVYDHHPAFSDGPKLGGTRVGKALFKNTYNNKGELFLSGHDHSYQRFAPRRPNGTESAIGVTQLVSGAGGKSLHGFNSQGSAYRQNTHDGALRVTLGATAWTSQFINTNGTIMDSASGKCR